MLIKRPQLKESQTRPDGFIQNSMKLLSTCKGKGINVTGRFERW